MAYPIQVTLRNVPDSMSLKEHIVGESEQLGHYFDGILGCRVVLECPHRSHRKGKLYRARVQLSVPGKELVVGRCPTEHHEHEDAYVAIRDAFEEVRRQLRDYAMFRHGRVKIHRAHPAVLAAG